MQSKEAKKIEAVVDGYKDHVVASVHVRVEKGSRARAKQESATMDVDKDGKRLGSVERFPRRVDIQEEAILVHSAVQLLYHECRRLNTGRSIRNRIVLSCVTDESGQFEALRFSVSSQTTKVFVSNFLAHFWPELITTASYTY